MFSIGSILDTILDWASNLVIPMLMLLPESPIQAWQPAGFGQFAQIMGWINYFVPLGAIAGIMTSYLGAVVIWYSVRWFLRFVRYID